MHEAVTLRPATATDADAIAHVHVAAWQSAFRGLISDAYLDNLDVAAWAARDRAALAAPDKGKEWLVAETAAGVVGFTSYGRYRAGRHDDQPGGPDDGEVHALYVEPGHWGSGTGRALLAAAVHNLSARGHTPVRLWTLTGNARTRRFYERYGFVADAEGQLLLRDGGEELTLPTVRYTLNRS